MDLSKALSCLAHVSTLLVSLHSKLPTNTISDNSISQWALWLKEGGLKWWHAKILTSPEMQSSVVQVLLVTTRLNLNWVNMWTLTSQISLSHISVRSLLASTKILISNLFHNSTMTTITELCTNQIWLRPVNLIRDSSTCSAQNRSLPSQLAKKWL